MEKAHAKKGSFVKFLCFFLSMVLKLSKNLNLLQICADLRKKPKSVKRIYIHTCGDCHYTLSENGSVYRDLNRCSWDISD